MPGGLERSSRDGSCNHYFSRSHTTLATTVFPGCNGLGTGGVSRTSFSPSNLKWRLCSVSLHATSMSIDDGEGSFYRGSRVMRGEGRNLRARRTQYVVRDRETRRPYTSAEREENA